MKTMFRIIQLFYDFFLAHFKKSLANRNFRLRWVFYLYLLIITIFANIYYFSYGIDHSSFVFAKDVHQSKLSSQIKEDSVQIHNLETEATNLKAIQQRLKRTGSQHSDTIFSNLRHLFLRWDNKSVIVELSIDNLVFKHSSLGDILSHYVRLYKPNSKEPFLENEVKIKTSDEDISSPEKLGYKVISTRIDDNTKELSSLKSSNYLRWNFVDFFYFSTITQATVGYGDMLPNSTFIRFLVALQTLIGIFITIIMVTYSYDLYRKRREREEE
jgi:hypothetical protein